LNNEPFELVRRRLAINNGTWLNPRAGNEANASVLMIDPFPTDPPQTVGTKYKELISVEKLIMPLFDSLMTNALFSQDLLQSIFHPDFYSRYMIGPVRKLTDGSVAPIPLASSPLSAFGGFIHFLFRDHDYHLGRYNCQQFLRYHYRLPLDNPIAEYAQQPELNSFYKKMGWITFDKDTGKDHLAIIPSHSIMADKTQPEWKAIDKSYLDELKADATKRAVKVSRHYAGKFIRNKILNGAASLAIGNIVPKKFGKIWEANVEKVLSDAKLLK
jgi:hypothetical protein